MTAVAPLPLFGPKVLNRLAQMTNQFKGHTNGLVRVGTRPPPPMQRHRDSLTHSHTHTHSQTPLHPHTRNNLHHVGCLLLQEEVEGCDSDEWADDDDDDED